MSAEDDEIIGLADPARGQYFLTAPDKLQLLVQAAGIQPTDHVVEIGAGIGSVARALPPSASLTLIELDERLIGALRRTVPHATVINADAFVLLQRLHCDVLLSNLPVVHTHRLLKLLLRLDVRTAVVAMSDTQAIDDLDGFTMEHVASITGDDFIPPQPTQSRLMRIVRTG